MFCASVTYPTEAVNFDVDYFAAHHAPMFAAMLGDNCVKWEVHKALASPGAPPPHWTAAAYFWVTSAEAFGAALAANGDAIYADTAKFSATGPTRGWAEVL